MSIKKYANIDSINNKSENEGKFIQSEDLFIINQSQIEETDFGDCKYDVMEVSVYDINNNLLPHKTGKNVAYIKTGDIKNYMYTIKNDGGQNELAIDIEKLLNTLGFTNGILKVNINFVRNKVGSENDLERVWIHEISPSRTEVRILPLKTNYNTINEKTNKEFDNINNLSKDFKYYKKNVLDALDSFESTHLESITNVMVSKFGNDFQSILKKEFGLSNFEVFKKRIFSSFKDSVTYYLNNRYYNVNDSNFGKQSEIRFENCEQYDFSMILANIQSILRDCIDYHTKTLKRRDITIKAIPKEFEINTIKKPIEDLVGEIAIREEKVRNVYNPKNVVLDIKGINPPKEVIVPIELPPAPIEPEPTPIQPIEPKPIIIEPKPEPTPEPVQDIIPTPSYGGGGGGGGYLYGGYEDGRGGLGREIYLSEANQRENIQ
jgi:hypothetical protein